MKGIRLRGAPMYLDMQATTPLDPRVLDTMLPFLTEQYGNPHSRTHMYGWESEDAVEKSRKQARTGLGDCHVAFSCCAPQEAHLLSSCRAVRSGKCSMPKAACRICNELFCTMRATHACR